VAIEALVTVMLGIVKTFLGILPDAGVLGIGGLSSVFSLIMSFDGVLPVHETFGLASVGMFITAGIFAYGMVKNVYAFIPGKAT
jgi:hypothetical protein